MVTLYILLFHTFVQRAKKDILKDMQKRYEETIKGTKQDKVIFLLSVELDFLWYSSKKKKKKTAHMLLETAMQC